MKIGANELNLKKGKTCILGGTFNCIHLGHLKLLEYCKNFDKIIIGLTSDQYVKTHKLYPSLSFSKRLSALKITLAKIGILKKSEIIKIDNEIGGADKIHADAIVVSQETKKNSEKINSLRKKNHLPPLDIIECPIVYGENLQKISCEQVYKGKISSKGEILAPIKIQIATDNPTKIQGAKEALKKIFGKKYIISHHSEESKVSAHPFDQETFTGAKNRAYAAWKRAGGNCDFALGIESGIFTKMKNDLDIDITVCCVYDGKNESYGTGMGFVVPKKIIKRMKKENIDLSEAMKEITGVEKIGWQEGALGWFSDEILHRKEQIESSVLCAFVPRIAQAKGKIP
jgi:inosine/xanthosine triphosphatase